MQIIDLKKSTTGKLMITWEVLFPTNFTDTLRKCMDSDSVHRYLGGKSAKGFDFDEGEEMQKVLVRMLFDKEYRLCIQDGIDITDKKKSQSDKYFNNAQGNQDYNAVITHIFNCAKSGNYDYYSFSFTQGLKKKLIDLFNLFPADYRQTYEKDVQSLIEQHFDSHQQLNKYKNALLNVDFPDRITCLVCIAMTWPIWDENSKQAADLASLIFPSDNIEIIALEKSTTGKLMITWGVLFPTNFTDTLRKCMDSDSVHRYLGGESAEGFDSDEGEEMQKVLVRMLLDKEYRLRTQNGADITDKKKSQFNKYFNYAQGKRDYEAVITHIFKCAKSGNYNYYSFPFTQVLKEKLIDLFNRFPFGYEQRYEKDVKILIKQHFGSHQLLSKYKNTLLNADFSDRITCLVCIAITWPIWDENLKQATDLANFIFPSESSDNINSTENNAKILNYTDSEKKTAAVKSAEAHELFNKNDYQKAAELFIEITNHKLADDDIIADAYYHCALCILDHKARIEKSSSSGIYVNARQLLLEAIWRYNSNAAIQRYKTEYKEDLETIPLIRDFSQTHGKARIILNAVNEYTAAFKESLPKEMQSEDERKKLITFAATRAQWEQQVDSIKDLNIDCRFLLFDDDSEKNFQDLIYILNHISALQQEATLANHTKTLLRWYKTVIYIRAREAEYSVLIDTALKRLGNYTIRVYIIDDNKWAAQYLLYQHPLFRPIQHIDARALQNTAITLSFTIITDQNPDLTCWLVKEAFWLGCFNYSKLTLSINIVGPDSEEIDQRLRFECPGIYGKTPDSDSVSRVIINKPYVVDSIHSSDALKAIRECQTPVNAFNYYVVNIGNSAENLNFAIKLRTLSIRNLVDSNQKLQNSSLPIITFYCPDSNIAHLSEHMVVQNVNSGDQWFNNYNVKPFGIINDRYAFEKLDGGYLEKVAQATHLQYCRIVASDSRTLKLEKLKDYFSQSYNRDSSMAVALSMPYRLFQTVTDTNGHIISSDLNIAPDLAPSDIEELAKAFTANRSSCQQSLLMYEHSRWIRWILSRGWESASAEQVLNYMRDGNPKHQLFIAKLHGCICGLNELQDFSNSLCNEAKYNSNMTLGQKKRYANVGEHDFITPFDFKATDDSNIKATAEIITTALYPEEFIEEEILTEK